jgi:hypothetical protein
MSFCSDGIIRNCTFTNNSDEDYYTTGGIKCNNSSPTIANCILWGNEPEEIYLNESEPVITYTDIEGGWEGEGNIDEDPLFIDPNNGDYHLRWDSPCVDAGEPGAVGGTDEVDIDGEPRVMGGRVDMGADEVGEKQADFTRDGRIDVSDLAVMSGAWDTQEGELRWYVLSDLFEDGEIDISDVAVFAGDWLWKADWYE